MDVIKDKSNKLYHKLKPFGIKNSEETIKKISIEKICIITVVIIIWNILILYYLYNLNDSSCNCIRDWRHNYLNKTAYINIVCSFLPIINNILNYDNIYITIFGLIIIVINAINIYALYTYVGDLNSTNCKCAVEKQPKLNYIFNDRRYVIVIIYILGIINILTDLNIGITMKIKNKEKKFIF